MSSRVTSAPAQIGRYEIIEELGRGAMGVVFKGRDPLIGRLVAVKTITADIADNPAFLERFRREAQAAGGLQHPNIVTIYEMGEFEGTPFIAMEYLEGESLEKKIDGQARLPLVHKAGYMVQASRALDYAHRRGVIHRDIKPANIVVTSEGVIKVVDFGIARILDTSKTQTGMMLGTLSYMAPEQISGKHADQRCDIWALGVVMYELLTYRPAFNGENHAALLMSILHDEPRSIRESTPECPQALEDTVLRALRKSPEERYQSMEALLADLEPIWISVQRDAVQKLISHGRELMAKGRLEEASAVLRKSLSLDTGNTAVKALYDQVNGMLGPNARGAKEPNRTSAGQQEIPVSPPDPGSNAGKQTAGLGRTRASSDPMATRVMGSGSRPRSTDNASVASSAPALQNNPPSQSRGGRAAETIFVSSLDSASPDRAESQRTGQQQPAPAAAKATPARSPGAQQPAPAAAARGPVVPVQAPPARSGKVLYIVAGVALLVAIGAVGYWKFRPNHRAASGPAAAPQSAVPPAAGSNPAAPGTSSVSAVSPPASDAPAAPVASIAPVSIEEQQRRLVDLAHEAADTKDFKTAQTHLDEAAKLNGPLNPLIQDLRREFSEDAHGAELRQLAAREEQLWDRSMKAMAAGEWDTAEKPLREILTLPEVNRHWAEAARDVDEILPERRKADQLWESEQREQGITGPEHRINEIKLLDQLLALGGIHQKETRERRDFLFAQFARNGLRKAGAAKWPRGGRADSGADSENAQLSQLKDELDQAVAQGDAKALEEMQNLRPRFKAIVDAGGQAGDARDCLNNLLGRAQKVIEDRLALEESNASQNADYRVAMKHFDQAAATRNTKMLRAQVQAEFEKIANAGGPRTPEAQRYVSELIPAALKKISK